MKPLQIFISYSHKDKLWKDRIVSRLHTLEHKDLIRVWDASNITPGQSWSDEIENAIQKSDIAILLISSDFLASDFIIDREIKHAFGREHLKDVLIIPIIVRPSLWSSVPEIAGLNVFPSDAKPLSTLSENDIDITLTKLEELVFAFAQKRLNEIAESDFKVHIDSKDGPFFFISHSHEDGDFAELLKLRLQLTGYQAWVDIDRLRPGVDWQEGIDKAIMDASAVIIVLSPDARMSEYVTYEWSFALGCDKNIIPIMLRQTTIHPRLARIQYSDFTNRSARPWSTLYKTLSSYIDV